MSEATISSEAAGIDIIRKSEKKGVSRKVKFFIWLAVTAAAGLSFFITPVFMPAFIMSLILYFPGLYVYKKAVAAFESRELKKFLYPLLIFLTVSFPLGFFGINVFRVYTDSFLFRFMYYIGLYYLPFVLYLFLFALVTDIVKVINKLVKIIPQKVFKKRPYKISAAVVAVFLTTGLILTGSQNFHNTRVTKHEITMPKYDSDIKNLRVAVVSDYHLSHDTPDGMVEETTSMINSQKPDLVLIPGDILDNWAGFIEGRGYEDDFKKMEAKYGVYAVTGNHEYYGDYNGALDFIRNSGMELIQDSIININDIFYVVGRNDRTDKVRKPLDKIMKGKKKNLPVIMMDHQPNTLDETLSAGIDMQVSGHTHHGQLFPFNYITNMVYELSWGYKKLDNTHLFVSCGIGGWGPPVRTNSYSEIMLIDISFK